MIESPVYEMIKKEGIEEGIEQEKYKTAKRMKQKGIPWEQISELTDLPLEEIKNL